MLRNVAGPFRRIMDKVDNGKATAGCLVVIVMVIMQKNKCLFRHIAGRDAAVLSRPISHKCRSNSKKHCLAASQPTGFKAFDLVNSKQ